MKTGTAALIAGACIYLAAVGYHGLEWPPTPFDDNEWATKTYHAPGLYRDDPTGARREFYWEATVPTLYRWYGAAAVRIAGTANPAGIPPPDLVMQRPSEDRSITADPATQDALRVASLLLFGGALFALLSGAGGMLKSRGLAALAVSPIALSPTFWNCVAWRMGPDAMLCLTLALTLVVWLRFHGQGKGDSWAAVLAVSACCGLAASAKQNGLLMSLAYFGYLLWYSRSWGRLYKPLVSALVAFLVFAAVNPMVFGNPDGLLGFVRMSISQRAHWNAVVAKIYMRGYGPMSRWEIIERALPAWPLVPLLAVPMWKCRREQWFAPVAWWGASLFVGTIATISAPAVRYSAPLELGLYFPAGVSLLSLWRRDQ